MVLLECGFKPRKIRQKAQKKPWNQLPKIMRQTKSPVEMGFSRIHSVGSQKLGLRELRLREPRLRKPILREPRLQELRFPIHPRTVIYTMKPFNTIMSFRVT